MAAGGGVGLAQTSTLPATHATELPAVAAPAPAVAANHARPASVTYAQGLLAVTADNSSLNQVLREIARKTGMTITGGVSDERVFGSYGPGSPAKILASLLDGTGSNMLLRESSRNASAELILTPRSGEPTPPNPNAPGFDDGDEPPAAVPHWVPQVVPQAAPQAAGQAAGLGGASAGLGSGAPADPAAVPATTLDPNAQSNGSSVPQSPNGVMTPQQVFQQLQQLQQQQPVTPK